MYGMSVCTKKVCGVCMGKSRVSSLHYWRFFIRVYTPTLNLQGNKTRAKVGKLALLCNLEQCKANATHTNWFELSPRFLAIASVPFLIKFFKKISYHCVCI